MAGMQAEQARDEAARALVALAGRPLFGGQDHVALAEAPGSPWFDTLGNALALEALSHPLLAASHAKLRDGIAAFVVAMEEQGALRRRAGPARLTIASDDTRRFHIETPSHVFTGDLWRGVLRQALRGDPGRPVALHTGNTLSFRFGGRAHRVDVESTIGACGIEPFAGGAVLFHESRILARGLVGLRARRVGALRYGYTIRADTPMVTLTVAFRPEPDVALSDLLLSTALDAMSPGDGVHFDCVAWRVDGAEDRRVEFRRGATPVPTGHADAIAFVQDTAPSRALAIHIRPRDPALLRGLTVTGTANGRIHWALAWRRVGDR